MQRLHRTSPAASTRCARRTLPAWLLAAVILALVTPAAFGAVRAGSGELVAPPISLGRLRLLLEEHVDPPPTPDEMSIVASAHRDMMRSYGAFAEGDGGTRWRAGTSLYDELRFMRRDPSRARMREAVRAQERMLADAEAADRAMFEAIAAVLAADEPDPERQAAVREAVGRAATAREADRLLGSLPMEEPTGVIPFLSEAVARLDVDPATRARLRATLAARNTTLVSLLRREIRDYGAFAMAAAGAFEQVFGGVLPAVGAAFSDEEADRLRARMRALCGDAATPFLDDRNAVRAAEDETIERLCADLPPDACHELRLRTSPWAVLTMPGGAGWMVLSTEGHLRDALAALPADDPVRPAVESIARRWRPAVIARMAADRAHTRRREDETFLDPGPMRGLSLALDDPSLSWNQGGTSDDPNARRLESLHAELARVLGPRIQAAGGSLGGIRVNHAGRDSYWLVQRDSMTEWQREMAEAMPRDPDPPSRLGMVERFSDITAGFTPEFLDANGYVRRGIPRRLDVQAMRERVRSTLDGTASDVALACIDDAWTTHERRWDAEVEAAIPRLSETRKRLVPRKDATNDDWPKHLREALAIRDTAWRAAELIDEGFFETILQCVPSGMDAAQQAVALERLRRFTDREVTGIDSAAASADRIRSHPRWMDILDAAALSPAADARVRAAIVRESPRFMAATPARRRAAFDVAAAWDEWNAKRLDLRSPPDNHRQLDAARTAAIAADRATVAMMAAMLAAAEDGPDGAAQRARLESALLRGVFRNWREDGSARRTGMRAAAAARTDDERAAVDRAVENYRLASRLCNERRARVAIARSSLGDAGAAELLPLPPEAAIAGSAERLDARLDAEFADLHTALEIDLVCILGRDRWRSVAPPDMLELFGATSRRTTGAARP